MSAYASLMSWYIYDNTLFDECVFPDAADRDVIIQELLAETAELEAVYPDFDVMKQMLGVFTRTRINAWNRMYRALTEEYNPIWNKDGTIDVTIERNGTGKSESSYGNEQNSYVTAFNDDLPRQSMKDTNASSGQNDSVTSEKQRELRREYGNIGVTKSSELVKDEIILRASYDIAHIIVSEMERRFCLLIY